MEEETTSTEYLKNMDRKRLDVRAQKEQRDKERKMCRSRGGNQWEVVRRGELYVQ